ncbi:MAG: tagaturonate reductase [Clostridia bacterium]|nr:tagaturonate reductase [Clostridia bacterium]
MPLTDKIIQFGEGGFLRGFADWMVKILNEEADFNAAVTVVQPIKQGMCETLSKQNCNYTHIMRGLRGGEAVIEQKYIDVISRCVEPYKDFEGYLSLAENKDFRFVISNTTESGIAFNGEDKPENAPEITFPAKVTLLLKRRFDLGLKGFIFLPCELIEKNGETLKKYILDYARIWSLGDDFISFVENDNIFCNTLVDRIVTGYPKDEDLELKGQDNMLNTSELFHLWVIEGPDSIKKEIPFDKTNLNVIFTDNLDIYRTRKVRILNGAHTSMIPYAMLCGIETVKDCMDNKEMYAFLERCVFEEIIPTLDMPENELKGYANEVFERFKNPFIKHLCASISLNSVSKFKVRVLPSLLEYVKRFGKTPHNLVFSLAKLIEFYKRGTPTDEEAIISFMREKSVKEILSNKDFWGEDISFLLCEVEKYVD